MAKLQSQFQHVRGGFRRLTVTCSDIQSPDFPRTGRGREFESPPLHETQRRRWESTLAPVRSMPGNAPEDQESTDSPRIRRRPQVLSPCAMWCPRLLQAPRQCPHASGLRPPGPLRAGLWSVLGSRSHSRPSPLIRQRPTTLHPLCRLPAQQARPATTAATKPERIHDSMPISRPPWVQAPQDPLCTAL
jgi:hypothetical protein